MKVPIGRSVASSAACRNWNAPTPATAQTANHTTRAVCLLRTGRSSGSSSSSPVGCPLRSPTTADSKRLSIDVDGSPNRDHRIKALDILVAHTNTPVTHGLADCLRVVGAVDAIAVAEL